MKFTIGILVVAVALLLLILFNLFQSGNGKAPLPLVSYSVFLHEVEAGRVVWVRMSGPVVSGALQDGRRFTTMAPENTALADRLIGKNVEVIAAPKDEEDPIARMLVAWLPFVLTTAVNVWMLGKLVKVVGAVGRSVSGLQASVAEAGARLKDQA